MTADDQLIAELRATNEHACIVAADHIEQLIRDIADRPDVAREKLSQLYADLQDKGAITVESDVDVLSHHLESCRRVARSLLIHNRHKP